MKITKLGHCCLYIEIDGLRILTDPGNFSTRQNDIVGIDVVLITHEHTDHLHTDSLVQILKNNPNAVVYTNSGVGKILESIGIPYVLLSGRDTVNVQGVELSAYDSKHEEIFGDIGQVLNTGYFIGNKLFYPGDSFCNPERPIPVLALPVAGPWCNLKGALSYALSLSPEKVFPVHDGVIHEGRIGAFHAVPERVLTEHGITFVRLQAGDSAEF